MELSLNSQWGHWTAPECTKQALSVSYHSKMPYQSSNILLMLHMTYCFASSESIQSILAGGYQEILNQHFNVDSSDFSSDSNLLLSDLKVSAGSWVSGNYLMYYFFQSTILEWDCQ